MTEQADQPLLAGDREKARKFYAHLIQQVGPKAPDRGEIKHAKAFLAKR